MWPRVSLSLVLTDAIGSPDTQVLSPARSLSRSRACLELDEVHARAAAVLAQQGGRRDDAEAEQDRADHEPGVEAAGERVRLPCPPLASRAVVLAATVAITDRPSAPPSWRLMFKS